VICLTNLSFGQQTKMPEQCSDKNGFMIGGYFELKPPYSCLNSANDNKVVVRVENAIIPNGVNVVGYTFNLTDGRDITKGNVFSPRLDTTVTTPGTYWVMQYTDPGYQAYIKCQSFEVIKPEQPDVKKSLCGKNVLTLTFLDTPKNKAHSGYEIAWGDGTSDPITDTDLKTKGFPYTITHTYLTPPFSKPYIIAKYIRETFNICDSPQLPFEFENNNTPRISELEGLTGGTSNKITMVNGADDKPYLIEQKLKAGNWDPTSKTISRKSGELFATETIIRLNATNEYCFRLKAFDDCNSPIISNEVCTIIPKASIVGGTNDLKLDWNSPDPAVVKYTIPYSESPSEANPYAIQSIKPTATTYTFKYPDCRKKYYFSINATIGNAPDQTIIKSPLILVDPKSSSLLPPITFGLVSVENNKLLVFRPQASNIKPPSKYKFFRSEGGAGNFLPITESANNLYEDQSAEPTKRQYCYKVEYEDECGNPSEQSPAFCSIYLNSTQENTLNWTPPVLQSNNPNPITYDIQSIDENNKVIAIKKTTNTSQNVRQQIEDLLSLANTNGEAKFVIKAKQNINVFNNGIPIGTREIEVSSNEYIFVIPAQLYLPTAFSPNEDGMNDIFEAKGRYIVEFNLEIYDRWGNVIFESQDMNTGWNGTTSDGLSPAQAGNYGFKIFGLDAAGNKFEKIGSVKLVR